MKVIDSHNQRACNICKVILNIEEFPVDSSRKTGRAYRCTKCSLEQGARYRRLNKDSISEYGKKWYAKNKEKSAEKSRKWHEKNIGKKRDKHLRKTYGISLVEYAKMVCDQNGLCLICNNPPTGSGRYEELFVDHDHATGRVRGLLCHGCNTALGMVKENTNTLSDMIDYIKYFKDLFDESH